ncbi:hypothetical protein K438DRAFT_1844704 [Mycena galopus ATCC 62051]|nr:hypothetical protein K438DRAFT_1844704 [Mycena galopus ATCC 62051]
MLTDLEADRALIARIQHLERHSGVIDSPYEARILDLEHSLAELRAEQVAAQERLDSYKYPVLSLPNEITSEIFIHFLPPYPRCPPVVGRFSPTHLTHICRRWRELALSTPALWRAIGPSDPDLDPQVIDVSKISDAWVSRSGSCPLSIEIIENSPSNHPPSIISTLIPHRARWEYLSLFLEEHSQDVLRQIKGPMPLLRHLRLSVYDHDRYPFEFRDLPQLRSVEVVGNSASTLTLPWAQLTSLTLRRVELGTERLVHCVLHAEDFRYTGIDIALPCLKSLDLRSHSYDDKGTRGFLATLVVPALHRLEVRAGILGRNPIDSLASFITTSGCKLLQEIRITWSPKRRTAVEDHFRAAFPSIPTISFE